MRGEIIEFFIIKQIKKPQLVLCSVVKRLGNSRALKKWGKTLDCVSCFPLHFFRALPLPACFTTEHSTVEASLFVKYEHFNAVSKRDNVRIFKFISIFKNQHGNKMIEISSLDAVVKCWHCDEMFTALQNVDLVLWTACYPRQKYQMSQICVIS